MVFGIFVDVYLSQAEVLVAAQAEGTTSLKP
jgi:hypothetical protein